MIMKKSKVFKKFFSVLLLTATLLVALHHHNDLKTHNHCPICILQSNFSSADTSVSFSLEDIETPFIPIYSNFISIQLSHKPKSIYSRAPPLS